MAIKQEVAYGIVRGLTEFWKCIELQDFTVKLDTVQFGCHRLLLAACSDFFRGLFRSGMKETEQNIVTIKDISSETFELILETLYTGHGILTNDNIIDIWKAAHQLQIHFLVLECENFVINTLSMENYAEYFYVSNTLNADVVLDTLWPFVLKNCNSFFHTHYFLQLPRDDVISLIQCHDLETKSEDDVIHAILKWVEFDDNQDQPYLLDNPGDGIANLDKINQKKEKELGSVNEPFKETSEKSADDESNDNLTVSNYVDKNVQTDLSGKKHIPVDVTKKKKRCLILANLLSRARMCLVSQRCLEMLLSHPLVNNNKKAKDIVIDALLYQLQVGKRNGQWPSRAVHRNNSDFIHCLVSAMQIEKEISISAYLITRKKWFKLPSFSSDSNINIASIDTKLYALGTSAIAYQFSNKNKANRLYDLSSTSSPKQLSLFQLHAGTWSEVKISLSLILDNFCVVVVDLFLYILSANEQTVWQLDPSSQKVTKMSTLPSQEVVSYVMSYDQSILVFYDSTVEGVDETIIYCYDTSLNMWTKLNNFDGSAIGLTSFKDDNFTYILQSNGALWKVVKPQSNITDFEFVVKLWSCNWPLYGAVTFMDTVYIHGAQSVDLFGDSHLRRSLPGAFSKIVYLESNYTQSSISKPFTMDKKYLV